MARRTRFEPLPGFPRKGKFQTKEEVDAYFLPDKIQCLLCGEWFKSIGGNHLTTVHGITADEYREMYGLPWHRGLTGRINHKKRSKSARRLVEDGTINPKADRTPRKKKIRNEASPTI